MEHLEQKRILCALEYLSEVTCFFTEIFSFLVDLLKVFVSQQKSFLHNKKSNVVKGVEVARYDRSKEKRILENK